jgi:redox-sensitive bicupin YhaK (pirin superfamily)
MMVPRYRGVKSPEIPEVKDAGGATIEIIAGTVGKVAGPVRDVVTGPQYLDVSIPPGLIAGKPIGEPIAWYGPIVMNTQEELRVAFEELERGTFIKDRSGAR